MTPMVHRVSGFRRQITAHTISGAVLHLTGGASLLLGAVALAGWLFHIPGLTRLGLSLTPMASNTAAGLLLDGAALLFIAAGCPKAALGGAIWSLLAGIATLVEYGLSVNLHIDEFLVRDYIGAFTANPGRMAPNAAVCFVLCGMALFWASASRLRGKWPSAVGALGAVALALGTAMVADDLTGVPMQVWGKRTGMAANEGLGFAALGLGILTFAWQYEGRDRWSRWLALAAGCLGFTISLCLGYTLGAEMQARTEFAARILWDYALETSGHAFVGATDALRYEAASPLPFVVIGVGTLFSVLAVFIVELALASRRRAQASEVANARLEREIDAHQRSEKALHTAYSELAAIYANAPVALLVVDEQLRVEKANHLAAAFAECQTAQVVGLRAGPVIGCLAAMANPNGCGFGASCDQCEIRWAVLDSLRNGVKHEGIESWVPVQANGRQELRCLLISSAAMEFGGRKALVCVQDISAGKHAEKELRESRARLTTALAEAEASHSLLAAAFTAQHDAIFVYNAEGTLVLTNPAADDYLGSSATGQVLPEVIERLHLKGGLSGSPTLRALYGETVVNAEGSAGDRELEMSSAPMLNAERNIAGAVTVMHDITRRRRMEDALQATLHELESALDEKTVLLKEVHHRVKNNLAVICSLLNMKADATDIPDARLALLESQHRVRSIALIHEQLYGTDHLDRVDFAHYIQELVAELNVACGTAQRGISVQVDSEAIELEVNRAVPCALIVNELVTNALKHAFPGERSGEVRITFRKSAPGWLELGIGDNGVGCPEGAGGSGAKSLGLRIVQILAKQLDGTIRQERGEGTRFVLRFPEGSASTCETSPSSSRPSEPRP